MNLARERRLVEAVSFGPDQVAAVVRAATTAVGGRKGLKALCSAALELCDASEAWILLDEDVVAHAAVHPRPVGSNVANFPFVHGRKKGALVLVDPMSTAVAPMLAELIGTTMVKDVRATKNAALRNRLVDRLASRERRLRHLRSSAARTAHDLKAPLVSMKGYVDMMLRGMAGPITDQMKRYLERIGTAVDRQRELIDTRVSAGSWTDDEAFDLGLVLDRFDKVSRPLGPLWIAGPVSASSAFTAELEKLKPKAISATIDEFRITVTATLGPQVSAARLKRTDAWVRRLGGTSSTAPNQLTIVLPVFTPR